VETYSTAADNQPGVEIHVMAGGAQVRHGQPFAGKSRWTGFRRLRAGRRRSKSPLTIDANGILNVSAKDKATNKEQKITSPLRAA